jgi:hypothetical protein
MSATQGRGELAHLLLLFLVFPSFEHCLQGVSTEVAPPDEPLVVVRVRLERVR